MPYFDYVTAHDVTEALNLLGEDGVRARPYAGGTDILVQIRADRRLVDRLVDVKGIPETTSLTIEEDGSLVLGAAVPCQRIYEDEGLLRAHSALADSASLIGSIQIQNRASIGGNLCNAAPSADCIPSLIVLGATCIVAERKRTREVPVEDFCVGPGRTCLEDGELLLSLRLPGVRPFSGSRYLRFIPRNEMDIAVAGVGASVVLDAALGKILEARVALASVAPTPLYVKEAGNCLVGQLPSSASFEAAAELAMAAARPIDDMRGTVAQRRHLVGVLTRRALAGAVERAREAWG